MEMRGEVTKTILLRALYDWIVDSGEIPNILVDAEIDGVVVPKHVRMVRSF